MNSWTALQIAQEAKAAGHDVNIPEDYNELIALGEQLYKEAEVAYDSGVHGDSVRSIIFIAQNEPSEDNDVGENNEQSENIDSIYEAKAKAQARIKKEKLPVPPEIDDDPPVMPRDLSKCSDLEIRRLSSEFNACFARANYLTALEEADELAAKQIADYYHSQAVQRTAEEQETDKVTILKAEANKDPEHRKWKELEVGHHVQAKILKSLRDGYLSNVERISREYSMRETER